MDTIKSVQTYTPQKYETGVKSKTDAPSTDVKQTVEEPAHQTTPQIKEQFSSGTTKGTEKDTLIHLGNDLDNITGEATRAKDDQVKGEYSVPLSIQGNMESFNPARELNEFTEIGENVEELTGEYEDKTKSAKTKHNGKELMTFPNKVSVEYAGIEDTGDEAMGAIADPNGFIQNLTGDKLTNFLEHLASLPPHKANKIIESLAGQGKQGNGMVDGYQRLAARILENMFITAQESHGKGLDMLEHGVKLAGKLPGGPVFKQALKICAKVVKIIKQAIKEFILFPKPGSLMWQDRIGSWLNAKLPSSDAGIVFDIMRAMESYQK